MYQFCKILSAKMLDLIKFKRFPGLPPPPGRALSGVRRGPRLGETFLCTDDIVERWRGGALTLYVISGDCKDFVLMYLLEMFLTQW